MMSHQIIQELQIDQVINSKYKVIGQKMITTFITYKVVDLETNQINNLSLLYQSDMTIQEFLNNSSFWKVCPSALPYVYIPSNICNQQCICLFTNIDDLTPLQSCISQADKQTIKIWIQQIANTISILHDNGYVHGNICCECIYVSQSHSIKITDFALNYTNIMKMCYLPFEIHSLMKQHIDATNIKITKETDVWQLGCLIYEIITQQQLQLIDDNPSHIIKQLDNKKLDQIWHQYRIEYYAIKQMIQEDPTSRVKSVNINALLLGQGMTVVTNLQIIKQRYTYYPQNRIGAGAFGECFKGNDILTGNYIVIKKNFVQQNQSKIELEAQLLKSADHPYIAHCLEYFWVNQDSNQNQFVIIMEYYENGDVAKFVGKQHDSLEPLLLMKWMLQLLKAIVYLHAHLIIHRDLKLENCFLDHELNLHLGDFGVARSIESTMASTVTGTIDTMAPEIIKKQKYGTPADIWSLGCVWYLLLTGRKPFDAIGLFNLTELIQNANYKQLSNTGFKDFENAINSMIQLDPVLRPSGSQLLIMFENRGIEIQNRFDHKDNITEICDKRFQVNFSQSVLENSIFGIYYKCFDQKTGRNVILKQVQILEDEIMKKVDNELLILETFHHINVIRVLSRVWYQHQLQKCYFFIMDVSQLLTLSQLLNQHKNNINIDVTKFWMLQILDAINFIHFHNITHRQIHTDTCFVNSSYQIKICDFGLYKCAVGTSAKNLIGSIDMMAPELVLNKEYSQLVDVWSLGCVWYTLINGVSPFLHESISETRESIVSGNYQQATKNTNFMQSVQNMLQCDVKSRIDSTTLFKQYSSEIESTKNFQVSQKESQFLLVSKQATKNIDDSQSNFLIPTYTDNSNHYSQYFQQKKKTKNLIIIISIIASILLLGVMATIVIVSLPKCPYKQNNQCVTMCTSPQQYSNTNICVSQCSLPNIYYCQTQCLEQCPEYQVALQNNSCQLCPENSTYNNHTCLCSMNNYVYTNIYGQCQCQQFTIKWNSQCVYCYNNILMTQCTNQCNYSQSQQIFIQTSNQLSQIAQLFYFTSNCSYFYNNSNITINPQLFSQSLQYATFVNFSFFNQITIQLISNAYSLLNSNIYLISNNLISSALQCIQINIENICISSSASLVNIAQQSNGICNFFNIIITETLISNSTGQFVCFINQICYNSSILLMNFNLFNSKFSSLQENCSILLNKVNQSTIQVSNININISNINFGLNSSTICCDAYNICNISIQNMNVTIENNTIQNNISSIGGNLYNGTDILITQAVIIINASWQQQQQGLNNSGLLIGFQQNGTFNLKNIQIIGNLNIKNISNQNIQNQCIGVFGQIIVPQQNISINNLITNFSLFDLNSQDNNIGIIGKILNSNTPQYTANMTLSQCLIILNISGGQAVGMFGSFWNLIIFYEIWFVNCNFTIQANSIQQQVGLIGNLSVDEVNLYINMCNITALCTSLQYVGIFPNMVATSGIECQVYQTSIDISLKGQNFTGVFGQIVSNQYQSGTMNCTNINGQLNLLSNYTGVLIGYASQFMINVNATCINCSLSVNATYSGIIIGVASNCKINVNSSTIQISQLQLLTNQTQFGALVGILETGYFQVYNVIIQSNQQFYCCLYGQSGCEYNSSTYGGRLGQYTAIGNVSGCQ